MAWNGNNMYEGLKKPKDLTSYKLFKGVTDFGQIGQFNNYESGYGFLVVLDIPEILKKLGKVNKDYRALIESYKRVLEYEFKGLSGIDNITAERLDVSDGISTLSMIGKVNQQSNSQWTMRYTEKSGGILTKTHELFLKGIKDTRTQVKTYHGLLESGDIDEPSPENEVFKLMYINTDNTARSVERAFVMLNAQPSTADYSIYEMEKGSIEYREIGIEMNGFVVEGRTINKSAQRILNWMNNKDNPDRWIFNSYDFDYTGAESKDFNEKKAYKNIFTEI